MTETEDRPLTTGDLARACGTTVRTVRFYEEAGILRPGKRTQGGHRHFSGTDLEKLKLIMDLREAGLSLGDIRGLFELKRAHDSAEGASAAVAEALEAQIQQMQRRIRVLRRLREELAATVAILGECATCDTGRFPEACGECDVMHQPELPRATRILWGRDD